MMPIKKKTMQSSSGANDDAVSKDAKKNKDAQNEPY
jgi:hypothetical protein